MKGKGLIGDNLELAYKTWLACGQSPTLTIRTLRESHGFSLSRQTLDEWKKEGDWDGRAARAKAVEQKANDPNLSGDERIIAALVKEMGKYEEYFDTLTVNKRDTQVTYAYTSLVTTIQNIRQKTAAYKSDLFIEFMRELISWLQKNDMESVPAIEKNFDEFIQFSKEKYKR
jgi:hypothetical protein